MGLIRPKTNNQKYGEIRKDGTTIIYATNGVDIIIDTNEVLNLLKYTWNVNNGYACTQIYNSQTKKYERILMHRLIMGAEKKQQVDHINHNTIDNRKSNLRIVTASQNQMNRKIKNSSGASGIWFNKKTKIWRAVISLNGNTMHLGSSKCMDKVLNLRKQAETKYYGDYNYKSAK